MLWTLRASLLACLVMFAVACGGESQSEAGARSNSSTPVKVEAVDLSELDSALASHRGRAVVLNFWATWCGPCVEELPDLLQAEREARREDLVVLLVSYDLQIPKADPAKILPRVAEFAERRKIELPILVYEGELDPINERFDLPGHIPVTLALDRRGQIVDRIDGPADKARFVELVQRALQP